MIVILLGIKFYLNVCIRYFYEYEYFYYDKDKWWNEFLKFIKYLYFNCLLCLWIICIV